MMNPYDYLELDMAADPTSRLQPTQEERAAEAGRWAGGEKVALISFGYQNIFATRLSYDVGKISTA
jgi:hypothetical protein